MKPENDANFKNLEKCIHLLDFQLPFNVIIQFRNLQKWYRNGSVLLLTCCTAFRPTAIPLCLSTCKTIEGKNISFLYISFRQLLFLVGAY